MEETVNCEYSLSLETRSSDFSGLATAIFNFSVKWLHRLVFVDQLGVPINFQDTTLSELRQSLEMPLRILPWQSLCEARMERVLDALDIHRSFWADITRVVLCTALQGLDHGHQQFDMNINLEFATKEEDQMEDIEEVSVGGYESDPDQDIEEVSTSTNEMLKRESCFVQDRHGFCCICLEELDGADKVMEIPCSHLFHCRCIIEWLERNDSCPLCRSKVEVEDLE